MIIGISGYAGSGKDTVGTIIQYLNCKNVGGTTLKEAISNYKDHEWWLEDQSKWEIKKWAGKLKSVAWMLTGIPVEKFEDQEFKKTTLGPEWDYWTINVIVNDKKRSEEGRFDTKEEAEKYSGDMQRSYGAFKMEYLVEKKSMSVRQFLQELGTDACRNGLHPNVWVNALMADYTPTQVQWSDGPVGGYEDGPMPNWVITDTRFPNEAKAIKDAGGMVVRVERSGVKATNAHPSETSLDNWEFDYVIHNNKSVNDLSKEVKALLRSVKLL
jgi:hypothetical protein